MFKPWIKIIDLLHNKKYYYTQGYIIIITCSWPTQSFLVYKQTYVHILNTIKNVTIV